MQHWLNALPYNAETGGETLRSFRGVVAHRHRALPRSGARRRPSILEQHRYPPLVLSFESIDLLDHVIFVYRTRTGWGSVARSRDPGRAVPATIPSIAKISSRALSARSYTDIPYKVFTSPRRVRFTEMEFAVPRAALVETLRELKAMVDRSPLRISFPVEVRTAPADDITLSTASGRDTAYIAVHMFRGTPYQAYFSAAERIFTAHEGRPHWGKVHTRDAEYFAGVYPRFGEFTELRDRLDPERRFGNDYLRRVLGE